MDDIREALSAFPEVGSDSIEDLASRIERIETATRKANETNGRTAGELTNRIDVIDQRVAAVAAEVARAKTLWPVALRSLEARLDDVVHTRRSDPAEDDDGDDGRAGRGRGRPPRRAARQPAGDGDGRRRDGSGVGHARRPDDETAHSEGQRPVTDPPAAAGATVVPLRTGEP